MTKIVFEHPDNKETRTILSSSTQSFYKVDLLKGLGTLPQDRIATIEFWHRERNIYLSVGNKGKELDSCELAYLKLDYYTFSAWLEKSLALWLEDNLPEIKAILKGCQL